MAKQVIDTTTAQPGGGQGEPLRTAFNKTNSNFNQIFSDSGSAANAKALNELSGAENKLPMFSGADALTLKDLADFLLKTGNLAGLSNKGTARTNLGLGSAAVRAAIGTAALYGRDSVLGTVSQSGGTPTGAVIQRGSNSNGTFTRFADGTQICTTQLRLLTISGNVLYRDWTFPAQFSVAQFAPRVMMSLIQGSSGDASVPLQNRFNPTVVNIAGDTASLRTLCSTGNWSSGDFVDAQAIAVGLWF